MQILGDTVIHNESRIEFSPVRAHYGGTRQLNTNIRLHMSCIEQIPHIVSALREYLITKCALELCWMQGRSARRQAVARTWLHAVHIIPASVSSIS